MTSLVAQTVKNLPAMQKTWVLSLGWEDTLEKRMSTPSSILAWRIPWTEDPGGLQSMDSQRVGHDWATFTFTFSHIQISINRSIDRSVPTWIHCEIIGRRLNIAQNPGAERFLERISWGLGEPGGTQRGPSLYLLSLFSGICPIFPSSDWLSPFVKTQEDDFLVAVEFIPPLAPTQPN